MPAIIFLQVLASLCYPIARYGTQVIEPFTFAFFRFVSSAGVLLTLVKLRHYPEPIARKDYGRLILLGILIIPLNQTLFLVGQSLTGAGHGAFLFATTPIWVFILALIHLKERLLWQRAVGVLLAVIGVAVIMSTGAVQVGADYLWGDVIILVSVLAWAYYTILGIHLVQRYGALRVTAYALSVGSILYFPFGLYRALTFDYSATTWGAWLAVAYMSFGMSVVVYVLWYWILKYMEASRLAVYHNIQPVIATVVAYLTLGEQLGWVFVIGGAIVLAGVLFAELHLSGDHIPQPHR